MASRRGPLCPGRSSSVRVSRTALAALSACLFAFVLARSPAAAQDADRTPAQETGNLMHFPPRPTPPKKPPAPQSNAPMLVQATEIKYDYTNNTVAAVGNVQIYYGGATIEADQVIYDQKTKRLRAEGNVRLTEPDGKITYGQLIDLTDDYRDGFVNSLRLETPDDTRFAASRADRAKGNYTVLQNGVYTACLPCKDDPKKPPLWQVQAARIIHDEGEKMLYFEDARIEFFGVPLAYVPFMSTPDPTVKRKSGFLFPSFTEGSAFGYGLEAKYFWALAPNYDMTLGTNITTKQGPVLEGEWRQRLLDGAYSIRASGLFQQDPSYFAARDGINSPTADHFRGAIQGAGQFAITDKWVWGWTGFLATDSQYINDYQFKQVASKFDPFQTGVQAECFAALFERRRRAQLFRYPLDVLLRLLRGGQSAPNSHHPPGPRLLERAEAASAGRRVQLQAQLHEPDPAAGGIRCRHPDRGGDRHLRLRRYCRAGQLPLARDTGDLFAIFRRNRLAPHHHDRQRPDDHAVPATARRLRLARSR